MIDSDVLRAAGISFVTGGAFCTFVMWWIQTRIQHGLSKELEAFKNSQQRDLEDKKAQLQRELENYRTQLLADAEAIKANQEVKKVVAVRLAEMKLDAISNIQSTIAPMSVMLGMIRSMQQSNLIPPYKDFVGAGAKLHAAATSAKLFLRPDHHGALVNYANAFTQGVQSLARAPKQANALEDGVPAILEELLSRHAYCEMRLYEYLHSMSEMD